MLLYADNTLGVQKAYIMYIPYTLTYVGVQYAEAKLCFGHFQNFQQMRENSIYVMYYTLTVRKTYTGYARHTLNSLE